jgi:ribosome-associated protein
MPQSDPLKPDENSKSQRKREMLNLQEIGETLVRLTTQQLEKMQLPENLLEAILHAKTISANEAKRRQMQYIGKIMRKVDVEPICLALKQLKLAREKNTAEFHQAEKWRADLISDCDTTLNLFLGEYPHVDRQHLRQLVRKAQQDIKNNKNTGAETALFRYLREIILGSGHMT